MKPVPSLLALAILASLPPLAHADSAAPDARTLDTVKVEASREKSARSTTQNVQVLSRTELDEVYAGDIAAFVGLRETVTGETLCSEGKPLLMESQILRVPVSTQIPGKNLP